MREVHVARPVQPSALTSFFRLQLADIAAALDSFFPPNPHLLRSTLFPYTTLFRSVRHGAHEPLPSRKAGGCATHRRLDSQSDWRAEKDRKSTRLNSSHEWSSYAVFCLKKKTRSSWRRKSRCGAWWTPWSSCGRCTSRGPSSRPH